MMGLRWRRGDRPQALDKSAAIIDGAQGWNLVRATVAQSLGENANMAESKIEYYQDKKDEWRWRRKAVNGQVVGASSEGYKDKSDCQKNANRDGAKDKWEFYTDKAGEHRWRAVASNGRQVGRSSEGYKARKDCRHNAKANGWPG
jgi:uncharacterized protein YegP (UPF0339 family)